MKKYLIEFIGTFFLVTIVCLTNGNFLAPIAVGSLLTAIIYMGYPISGAHYNPVTTLSILILKKISLKDGLIYILIQFLAGGAGALVYYFIWGRNSGLPRPNMDINILKPLFVEMMLTYIMILVILFVAASKKSAGNNYYGLAIVFTVTGIAIAGSALSDAAYNPSLPLGSMVVDKLLGSCPCNPFEYGWIYLLGPSAGSVLATYTFKFIDTESTDII